MIVRQVSAFCHALRATGAKGQVVQIFDKSINCQFDHMLLHISGREDYLSPFGLTLSEGEFQFVKKCVDIGDTLLPSISGYCLHTKRADIELICTASRTRDCILPAVAVDDGMSLALRQQWEGLLGLGKGADYPEKLYQLSLRLACEPLEKLGNCFAALLGLGIGLTPSGDDIILGFCSFEMSCKSPAIYSRILAALDLDRTTQVSAAYLQALSNRRVSSLIKDYLLSFNDLKNDVKSADFCRLSRQILDFGHHSGKDILWGMLLAVYRRKERRLWQNVLSH